MIPAHRVTVRISRAATRDAFTQGLGHGEHSGGSHHQQHHHHHYHSLITVRQASQEPNTGETEQLLFVSTPRSQTATTRQKQADGENVQKQKRKPENKAHPARWTQPRPSQVVHCTTSPSTPHGQWTAVAPRTRPRPPSQTPKQTRCQRTPKFNSEGCSSRLPSSRSLSH